MSKKIVIGCSIALIAILGGIKLNNFFVGQRILGKYTSLSSKYLLIKPIKRDISHSKTSQFMTFSLSEIKFDLPKTDTLKIFKHADAFKSFIFRDSSRLKVYKDSINLDFPKILSSMEPANEHILNKYIKKNKITSNFDLLLFTYNKTPDDISFFNLSRENTITQYTFLKLKDLCDYEGEDEAFYYFVLKKVKGFQFGSPERSKRTSVDLYTSDGKHYTFVFTGFKQQQIDYVIASID